MEIWYIDDENTEVQGNPKQDLKRFSGSSDPYPDFTDPDPTHLLAIVKNNFLKHRVTDKKYL